MLCLGQAEERLSTRKITRRSECRKAKNMRKTDQQVSPKPRIFHSFPVGAVADNWKLCDHLPPGTPVAMRIFRRLHYWWSIFVAGALLLTFAPPVLLVAWLTGKHELVYPWALFGGRNWLRLSGMKVHVSGGEHLDPNQIYVFISNHRSYLDTA